MLQVRQHLIELKMEILLKTIPIIPKIFLCRQKVGKNIKQKTLNPLFSGLSVFILRYGRDSNPRPPP